MNTEIVFFGQLAEKTGLKSLHLPAPTDTESLLNEVRRRFPALADAPVIVAVNRRTVTDNTPIEPGDTVALMPPFSGG